MRKVSKEKIIEYAKELYLTPNEIGNHKYSLRSISAEIEHKFSKKLANTTILNWSRKYGWNKLWEQAVKEGLTKGFKSDEEKSKEEQLEELIAERKHEDFERATNLKTWAYDYIKEKGFSSVYEALRAIELGMKYTQDIQEKIPEKNTINIIVNSEKAKELTDKVLKGKNADKDN